MATDKYIFYDYEGKNLKVPVGQQSEFESKVPSAKMMLTYEGKNYKVPLSELNTFVGRVGADKLTYSAFDDKRQYVPEMSTDKWLPFEEPSSDTVESVSHVDAQSPSVDFSDEGKEKPSFWETLAKGAVASGVDIKRFGIDTINKLAKAGYNNPNALGPGTGLAATIEMLTGKPVVAEDAPLNQKSKELKEKADALKSEAEPTKKGYGELIKDFELGTLGQKAIYDLTQSAPMMVAAATGLGVPYAMGMYASSSEDAARETPEVNELKREIYAAGNAALELAVENLGGPLKNLLGKGGKELTEDAAKEFIETAIKEGSENIGKRIVKALEKGGKRVLKEGREEGREELITSFGSDALGEALDLIDGNKDYGIRAQWQKMKEENPDANLWDFAKAKGKELMESYFGGFFVGNIMSGTEQVITDGVNLSVNNENTNKVQRSADLGASLDYQDMYDVADVVREQAEATARAIVDNNGASSFSVGFLETLSAEETLALSTNKDIPMQQRKALSQLAQAKALQEGLNHKLDDRLENDIAAANERIESASENGTLVTGVYNGANVYVKGGVVKNGSVTLPDGSNGPVIIIDSSTGAQTTANSDDISSAIANNARDYALNREVEYRDADRVTREQSLATMSPRAKTNEIKSFVNSKTYINLGNGLIEVQVEKILPETNQVIIKGKKGDLGGQSVVQMPAAQFYDAIARKEDGTPVFVEHLPHKEQAAETPVAETTPEPQPEAPVVPEGPQDFTDYVGPMVINGVPVNVEVTGQDNTADRINYTYVDQNGVTRAGSTTVAGFAEAVQQAGQLQTEVPVEETPPTENIPTENVTPEPAPVEVPPTTTETPAPQNVTLKPEDIDWDALFDTDQEAFFTEMQNQFGDKSERYFNAFLAAAQKELDKLEKSNPTQMKDIIANEARKDALQARIEALNGMIARIATPATEVAPTTPTAPATQLPTDNVPDVSVDKAADARARGFRMTNGQRVDRRGETAGAYGNDTEVAFTADSKGKRTGKVKVIDASNLIPSHISGVENVEHFLPEAQPKKRTDTASTVSASLIAQNMNNPQMTNVASSAYEGAPIVNRRGEVIQGNNRSAAILEMYQSHQQKAAEYKQYLIDHAAEFGLNAEEVAAMQKPVLVRELDVDDADAITLGQYTMQDMESGGSQMIDSGRAIAGLSNKGLLEDFITRLLAEENEDTSDMNLSDLITRNGNEALKMLYQNGIINQTQYQSALGANGRITADARAALRGIIEQQLFAGGIDNLSVMFEVLPDKAKKAIMQTISRDLKNPDDAKVTPYLQEAIEVYYQLNQQSDFVAAKTKEEVDNAVELFKGQTSLDEAGIPAEKYSNFAFDLAKKFKTLTLKQQRELLNQLYDTIAGVANIFGESEGKPLGEAVTEVYGTNLNKGNNETNGQSGAAVLEGGNGGSQEGQQGSTGNVGVRPEAGESWQGATDGGANPTVGGGTQTTGEVTPVAPNPVANPVDAAKAKERRLKNIIARYDLTPEYKYDLAVQIGKEIGDFFATIEEYESFEEDATDFGAEYNKAVREGVDKSFAERTQNTGNSQENGVTLETEPKQGDNGTETGTETPEGTEGYNGTTGGQHTDDEGGKEGTQETEGLRGGDVNQEIKYPAREGDATRQLLMDTFGFTSVSPGVSQENLNHIYDFLMEMSKMLGISPTSISHGATLGMGVLGEGRIGTLASYQYRASWDGTIKEPYLRFKNSLLSSIAHEWWHSLDQALSYYETGRGKKPSTTASADEFTGRPEVLDAVRDILKAINKSGHKARLESELKYNPEHLSYSKRKKELAARFFEGYIKSKFAEAGIVVNGFSATQENTPTEEEVKPVIPAFDRLFKVLKEKAGKKEGSTVLYHIGQEVDQIENEKRVSEEAIDLTNSVIDMSLEGVVDVERASDEQAKEVLALGGIENQFSVETDKPIFISNAALAVQGIKMEKATPEQWLKMIEKAGGLKAGEDKWMGLSDWLKSSDKKTLTKQEVLDYITANTIQIEEVNYAEIDYDKEDRKQTDVFYGEFEALYDGLVNAGESFVDADTKAFKMMKDTYGIDFAIAFSSLNGELLVEDRAAASRLTGIPYSSKPIDETRLNYTTYGLKNNKEIALVVPTIDSWNENDAIHFGEAGDGRAVAWVRFGEVDVPVQDANYKRLQEIYDRLAKLDWKTYNEGLSMEEYEERSRLREERDNLQELEGETQRVLVIDEIQSKRHQEGRERGYRSTPEKATTELKHFMARMHEKYDFDSSTPFADVFNEEEMREFTRLERATTNAFFQRGVPDAPFDKNWHELAMKRMLRYAAENGYDVIAWTKGEQQAERYNIGTAVEKIILPGGWIENNSDKLNGEKVRPIYIVSKNMYDFSLSVNEEGVIVDGGYTGQNLSDVVGKEMAVKLMTAEPNTSIEGDELRIGGEGMKGFYDKMLPAFMNKYGKKWGIKVSDITLPRVEESGRVMHSVPVTEAMKASVMEGQPMFLKTPNGIVYGWTDGKKIYLTKSGMNPNTKIHEYTHLWAKAMMQKNPKGWNSIKTLLKKSPVWNQVMNDANYSDIHGNEDMVASEVISRLSGTKNAAKLEHMAQQMIDDAKGTMRKVEARGLIQNLKDALNQFWSWVGKELFGIEKFNSIDEITDRVLYDLVNKTDLGTLEEGQVEASIIPDGDLKTKLQKEIEDGEYITLYRAVRKINGKYYSPKMSKLGGVGQEIVLGQLEQSDERPDLAYPVTLSDGTVKYKVNLDGGDPTGSGLKSRRLGEVDYNPYIHASDSMMNDQFTAAFAMPELTVIEVRVPKSELTSGYHAQYAAESVGKKPWKKGVVDNKLPKDEQRTVYLSRYDMPVREVSTEEIADHIAAKLLRNGIAMPYNLVTPQVAEALIKRGVEVSEKPSGTVAAGQNEEFKALKERVLAESSLTQNNLISLPKVSRAIKTGNWTKEAINELNKTIENVEEGKAILKRYTPSELTGLLEAGSLLVGASVISRGSQRNVLKSGKRIGSLEERAADTIPALISWAKATGVWKEYAERSEEEIKHSYWTSGGEAQVFYLGNGKVEKIIGLDYFTDPQLAIDRIAIHNALFPETRLTVTGFGTNKDGKFAIIVEQPVIQGKHTDNKEIDTYIESLGFDKVDDASRTFANDELYLSDLHEENVLNQEHEKYYVIDGDFRLNTPDARIGGTRLIDDSIELNDSVEVVVNNLDTPSSVAKETAAQTYDRVVNEDWQEFQRQFQDALQPVRIAIEAIQKETGNIPIEDYENYLLIQNQISSRSRVEIDNFARRYYTPIIKQVNAIIDKIMDMRGLNKRNEAARAEVYKEVRQYLIAKHGLERNKYYQEHKTRSMTATEMKPLLDEAEKDYQTEVNMINMNNNLTDAERELQLRDALDVYNATVQEIKTREVPDLRDYSGLTSLFGLESKEWEQAEGMAQELVDNFENSLGRENNEDGEMITQSEEIDALWKRINAATNKTLRHSYESGMLSRQQYNEIKEMFKFYIPLRGFDETTAEDVYSYARFDGNRFNAAVHKAEGRTSVADDPLAIIMNMAESEIAQGNKNRAKQALYNYLLNRAGAMNEQNSLMQLEDVWYLIDVDEDGNKTYQIVTPDHASGETYEEFENKMQALAEEGRAEKSRKGKLDIGYRFQKQDNRNAHYVFVKINGVEKAIYINGDPKAADAINGRYQKELGTGIKLFRDIQRVISSTFTNYSLEFTARNYFRDMIYSHINIGVRESDPAYRKKFRQNWRHNNMGAMMRMLKAYRAGEYDGVALTEDEAAFVEFMENGGQTGYTLINSVENHKKDLQRAIERMQSGIEKGGVKDSTIFKATLGSIELLNEASELVTRFAAYKTSRDMGRGINSSIKDAKEVTVNFNTKGAQDGQGWMGAVARYFGWCKYFFNASVQGVQNLKSMRDANKLKFGTVVGGVVATGFFMPIFVSVVSELLGGDDEEEYWNIPEYERQNNFCIPLGNGKYAKVPLPIGFREVYAIGDMVAASLMDKRFNRNAGEVGMDITNKIASIILPVNPLESMSTGLNMWQTFLYTGLPSSAQVLIQNATNTDWKGTPLQKEYTYNENDPKWMKAFASNPDWMKGLSKWCNEHINLDGDYKGMDWSPEKLENTLSNLGGGIYSLIKKSGKTLSMIWNEENRNLSNVPLAGVVLGSGVDSDDRFVTDAYFDMKDFYDANLNYIKRRAEQFGYDLEDVFLKEKGKHQPKMLDIYQNRNFDFMQEWYKGNKELEEMNREIKKLKKEIAAKEKPSTALLNKLAKKQDEFNAERSDFVNDMLELD